MLVTYPISGKGTGQSRSISTKKAYSPEQISADVLKNSNEMPKRTLNEPISRRSHHSFRLYFNDGTPRPKRAGELAASLSNAHQRPPLRPWPMGWTNSRSVRKSPSMILARHISIFLSSNFTTAFSKCSPHGNTRLGGDDLDKRLLDFLIEKIKAAGGPNFPSRNTQQSRARGTTRQLSILSVFAKPLKKRQNPAFYELEVEIHPSFLTPDFSFKLQALPHRT